MKSIMKLNLLIPGLALVGLLAGPLAAQAEPTAPAAGSPEISAQKLADFRQKVEPLQDQLWAKEMEVEALSRTGKIPELRVATAEAIKLRTQIREERRQLVGPGGGKVLIQGAGPGFGGWRADCPRADFRAKAWFGPHNRGKGRPGQGCPCPY